VRYLEVEGRAVTAARAGRVAAGGQPEQFLGDLPGGRERRPVQARHVIGEVAPDRAVSGEVTQTRAGSTPAMTA
jgi:hypothetical protein